MCMARQNRLASAPNTMPRPMACKSEMADNSGIAAIAAAHSSPQEAVDALVAAALDAGGTDNITVIVADMPLTEPEHHAFSAFRLDEGEDIGAIEDATLQTLRTIRSA